MRCTSILLYCIIALYHVSASRMAMVDVVDSSLLENLSTIILIAQVKKGKGSWICIAPRCEKLASEALRHGSHSFYAATTPHRVPSSRHVVAVRGPKDLSPVSTTRVDGPC